MMKKTPRIDILYVPVGNGHLTAAKAIAEAVAASQPAADVQVLDALTFTPGWFRWLYRGLWRLMQVYTCSLWERIFERTFVRLPRVANWLRLRMNRYLLRRLEARLRSHAPDELVCTHYLPAILASRMRREGRLGSRISVVITDYAPHPAWIYPGVDRYFVASEAVARYLRREGVDADRIEVSGIPLCADMAEQVAPLPEREARCHVLFLAYGVPARQVDEALSSFAGVDCFLDIVAGSDGAAADALRTRAWQLGLRAVVHGRVPSLRPLLDRAHVVVGKPGGLTTSECLARGRALVVPWKALGHERRNLDHLLHHGAAAAALEASDAGPLVGELAAQAGRFHQMHRSAVAAARPRAAFQLVETLLGGGSASIVAGAR